MSSAAPGGALTVEGRRPSPGHRGAPEPAPRQPPMSAAVRKARAGLRVRYAVGIASAQFVAAVEVLVVVVSLRGRTVAEVSALFTARNLVLTTVLVAVGMVAACIGSVVNLAASLRWFVAGQTPDREQRHAAMTITVRQSAILMAVWLIGGVVFLLLNLEVRVEGAILITFAAVLGGVASACTGLLRTQRTLRPLAAAAHSCDPDTREMSAGLETRLLVMWMLCGALPCVGIAGLLIARSNGWILEKTASAEIPMLVFSLVALPIGLRAVALVSRSIRDPVREVVDAMAEVERGHINATAEVYDRAEIGQLQDGFNRMVSGLKERDRLRDLFGRYVGSDVARRAVREQEWPSGDVRDAAILFVDLTGFTGLAATQRPEEVADVLNAFFRIVVAAVDERHGLINKFQGDAALVVFGAPLQTAEFASAALSTARTLGVALRELAEVDFGIGVSAGPVFAGNVGAESRYEYTVIGDAVNEASRLADHAKTLTGRVVCSRSAFTRADPDEQRHWAPCGSTLLRGRLAATDILAPVAEGSGQI